MTQHKFVISLAQSADVDNYLKESVNSVIVHSRLGNEYASFFTIQSMNLNSFHDYNYSGV